LRQQRIDGRGYLGNGSTAPQAYVVFLGEAVTSASAVTSTVAYAYNGLYDSGFTATLPGVVTQIQRSHNIGVYPRFVDFRIQNTTVESNYAVGDELGLNALSTYNGSLEQNLALSSTKKVASLIPAAGAAFVTVNKTTGASVALTAANWQYRVIAQRGW
jgi:hypothetical protein